MDSLPYEVVETEIAEDIEVVGEKQVNPAVDNIDLDNDDLGADGEQTELF